MARTKDPLKVRVRFATFLLTFEDVEAATETWPRGLVRRDSSEEEEEAEEEVIEEAVTVTDSGTRREEPTARTTDREEEEEDVEVGEEVIEEAAEDGEIEETVVVICLPTIGRRMTVLTIVTTEAAEIAAMGDAVVEDMEKIMEVAETIKIEEEDTPRTGSRPWPGTRGWRRSSSTPATVRLASTLTGESGGLCGGERGRAVLIVFVSGTRTFL